MCSSLKECIRSLANLLVKSQLQQLLWPPVSCCDPRLAQTSTPSWNCLPIFKNFLKLTSNSLRGYLQVAILKWSNSLRGYLQVNFEDSDIPTDFRSKTYAVRFVKSAPLKSLLAVSVKVLPLKSLLPYFIVRFVYETLGFMLKNNLLILRLIFLLYCAKSLGTGRPEQAQRLKTLPPLRK